MDHLIFRGGGGWDFFEINSLFPYRREKNKISSMKLKTFVLHLVNFVEALYPGSYKGLQITQKLTCIKHVDLPSTSILANSITGIKCKL